MTMQPGQSSVRYRYVLQWGRRVPFGSPWHPYGSTAHHDLDQAEDEARRLREYRPDLVVRVDMVDR